MDKRKQIPDTKWEGSWADEESKRPAVDRLSEHFGKPAVLIKNLVIIGSIDPKWARTFNG